MDLNIKLGTNDDINELEQLYNDLNDYLAEGVNYPGWKKGVYPVRETAVAGVSEDNLFIFMLENKIVGSVILNQKSEKGYDEVSWEFETDYTDVIVIHTLVIHPGYISQGIGRKIMNFAEQYAIEHNIKSIRLDVSEKNLPAIHLYEKCGYKFQGTVDLGLEEHGLKWFDLYEKVLKY